MLEVARRLAIGHEVRLLLGGFAPRQTYPELSELPITRLGRLDWLMRRVTEEAVIANSFGANLLALRNGPRVGYWVHSVRSVFLAHPRQRPDLAARRLLDWLAVRRAGQLIANSAYTANSLRRLYGRDPDAVVYPGVDTSVFQPGVVEGRYAVTVARLAPEKGLERLLRLWRDLPDVPLHVVGGGEPAYVQRLREQAPVGVVFRGPIHPRALAAIYAEASLAVFAARGEEFGIAPLEAMASGLAVIAWRDGGLVETVVDGQTGFLADEEVTFRQRVRLLAQDVRLRRRLGEAARAHAQQFSWDRTASGIEAVCQRLAASSRPSRAPRL